MKILDLVRFVEDNELSMDDDLTVEIEDVLYDVKLKITEEQFDGFDTVWPKSLTIVPEGLN